MGAGAIFDRNFDKWSFAGQYGSLLANKNRNHPEAP
jgi:hypothetical protein